MRKHLLLFMATALTSMAVTQQSHATGFIIFDTYLSSTTGIITDPLGSPLGAGYHATLYYALGNVLASVNADPSGIANPSTLGGGLSLFTGPTYGGQQYPTPFDNLAPGYILGPNSGITSYVSGPVTFMIAAYNGADYDSSTIRGHSAAFLESSLATGIIPPSGINGMDGFQVAQSFQLQHVIPEPGTIALFTFGFGALFLVRRKSA